LASKILAFDDDAFILELISMIAAMIGRPETATESSRDGTQLMHAGADQPFDGLLMVVNMPRKRAIEFFAGVHIRPACGQTPKIVLTALDRQAFVQCALRRGSANHANWSSNCLELHKHMVVQTAAKIAIDATKRHIVENPRLNLDLPALAEVAGVSPRHLSRLFRMETGMSPTAYVERTRVDIARQLLEGTTDPIKTVAHAAGFGSTTTLRRAFLRRMGVAPAAYRLQFRTAWSVAGKEDGSAAELS
jgi:AraC-like DNA-binding protein